jgi:peptidoglycan/xylan/chitin deacetylase (PgdA/CDA1 family)
MPRVPAGAPFDERGGRLRGALDLVAGRYPRFLFGGDVGDFLPVFHFHETTTAALEPAFAFLVENGYRPVVSDDVATLVREGRHPGARTVMLAFDDAWASLWFVVGPLLRKYGLRAVTYAIPGRIADAPAPRSIDADAEAAAAAADRAANPFVTWPELHALSTAGLVDVQSHTWSHSMIFTGHVVAGHVTRALADESMLNRPRLDDDGSLRFLTPAQEGAPLFERRSRMSDGLRFFPAPDAFAPGRDWPVGQEVPGRWETTAEQEREIEHELAASREALETRLGTRVRHICLPWGVSGAVTRRLLERTGFATAFANRMSGRFAVSEGDDPYFLKRLSGRHLFALPGRGRRTFAGFA